MRRSARSEGELTENLHWLALKHSECSTENGSGRNLTLLHFGVIVSEALESDPLGQVVDEAIQRFDVA